MVNTQEFLTIQYMFKVYKKVAYGRQEKIFKLFLVA